MIKLKAIHDTIKESIDSKYWLQYHDGSNKKETNFRRTKLKAFLDWNLMANSTITRPGMEKVTKVAKEFFKANKWISIDILQAMIAQES